LSSFAPAEYHTSTNNDASDLNLEDMNLGGGVSDEEGDQEEVHKMKRILEKKTLRGQQ
jgi:hypothetical protein